MLVDALASRSASSDRLSCIEVYSFSGGARLCQDELGTG